MIEVANAIVNYGPVKALASVSLEVRAGEMVGLVGPNGCGKSTLIRAITHRAPLARGCISVLGQDIKRLSPRKLARLIAVVPQNPSLPDSYNTFDLVMMGRTPYLGLLQSESERDLEAVRRAMSATSTLAIANRSLGELSGGERQRAVIARALAQETPVLLLDEPTAHLDIGQQAAIFDLIQKASNERSLTVLVAIHDLTLAAQYCQRVILLNQGRVAAEGRPEHVLRENLLKSIYGTSVDVFRHPRSGLPVVMPSSDGREALYGVAQDAEAPG
jgi:iron complex transport system ATP-binding protein